MDKYILKSVKIPELKRTILLLMLYALVFFLVNIIHFRLIGTEVILYGLVVDIIISTAIMLPFIFNAELAFECKILIIFSGMSCLLSYCVLVPTALDRSVSIYMLSYLNKHNGGVQIETIHEEVPKAYIREMDVIDQRLFEQQASGNIIINHGIVVLTDRGMAVVGIADWYRENMLPIRGNDYFINSID